MASVCQWSKLQGEVDNTEYCEDVEQLERIPRSWE